MMEEQHGNRVNMVDGLEPIRAEDIEGTAVLYLFHIGLIFQARLAALFHSKVKE